MLIYTRPTLSMHHASGRLGLELALLEGMLAPVAAAEAQEETATPAVSRNVLVVDDDADLRAYVRQCLEPHCWITEAADGAEALAEAVRLRPALVVTDAVMPLGGGAVLCRALRADPRLRGIPILAISGETSALDSADAFLPKPFTRRQIVEAVQALLREDS